MMRAQGGFPMKMKILVLFVVLAALGVPCFAGAVHVTGNLTADYPAGISTEQIISTFANGSQPMLWGFGWEVVLGRIGFGGDFAVNFYRDPDTSWWLDWYAPALYLSLHPFGANRFLDPFVQVGVGNAGRVHLDGTPVGSSCGMFYPSADGMPLLSLFPFVAAGLGLNFDGLLVSARVAYTPYNGQIPVTNIQTYPLGTLQVTLAAGLSLGW
jgi:hypothetical protein